MAWAPARELREPEPAHATQPAHAPQGPSEEEIAARERRRFEEGYRQGQVAGRQESAASANAAIERFSRAASDLAGYKPRLRREAEEDVVKLALAIGRRVLHRELSIDAEALLGMVRTALERLERREVRRLRMHPDDAAQVRQHLALEVAADATLARGSMLFETDRGAEDWSVETQLEEIQRGLMDRLHGRR